MIGYETNVENKNERLDSLWPLASSFAFLGTEQADTLKQLLLNSIVVNLSSACPQSFVKLNGFFKEKSSIIKGENLDNETSFMMEVDSDLIAYHLSDNEIFSSMVNNDIDVDLFPEKEYNKSIKFKVEEDDGPYFVNLD